LAKNISEKIYSYISIRIWYKSGVKSLILRFSRRWYSKSRSSGLRLHVVLW